MNRLLKTTLIAAAAAAVIGSPAFAEAYLNEMGTGDVHPIIQQSGAAYVATTQYVASPRHVASTRRSGLHSFAMVGGKTWTGPELTGGGSRGYNEQLSTY